MTPQPREVEQPERLGKCWGRDGPDGAEGEAGRGWAAAGGSDLGTRNIAALEATGPGPSQGVWEGDRGAYSWGWSCSRAPALQTDFTHISREAFNLSSQPCGRRSQGLVLSARPAGLGRCTVTCEWCSILGHGATVRTSHTRDAHLTPVTVWGAAGALRAFSGEAVSSHCCVPLAVYIFSSLDLSQSCVSPYRPPSR